MIVNLKIQSLVNYINCEKFLDTSRLNKTSFIFDAYLVFRRFIRGDSVLLIGIISRRY